jgi:hypothetical protein
MKCPFGQGPTTMCTAIVLCKVRLSITDAFLIFHLCEIQMKSMCLPQRPRLCAVMSTNMPLIKLVLLWDKLSMAYHNITVCFHLCTQSFDLIWIFPSQTTNPSKTTTSPGHKFQQARAINSNNHTNKTHYNLPLHALKKLK